MRHWQWSVDVRAVTYATLLTLHWLQKEGFINSEECSSKEYSKEDSLPDCNSILLNENDHVIEGKSGNGKIKLDKNEKICDNEDESRRTDIKIKQRNNKEMEVKKGKKDNIEKGEKIGRIDNDYYNRHSEWILNTRKYCFKNYGNSELFSDGNSRLKEGE